MWVIIIVSHLLYDKEKERVGRMSQIQIITPADLHYPFMLRTLPLADQPTLRCYGNVALLNRHAVGFTGTEGKNITPTSKESAYLWAQEMAGEGYVVISGGCSGVDTAAHNGARDSGGSTIVVLPHAFGYDTSGKSNIHEKENKKLFNDIAESDSGLLITMYASGNAYGETIGSRHNYRFHERNEIIVLLSLMLFAWQFPQMKSGVVNTMSHARRHKRPIRVALPGSVSSVERQIHWSGTLQYLVNYPDLEFDPDDLVNDFNDKEELIRLSTKTKILWDIQNLASESRNMPQYSEAK